MADLPFYAEQNCWEEIRYDINEAVSPDVIGSLQDMSIIEDSSVDSIFSSHNIEHVHSFEAIDVLREFRRVLKDDGFAIVRCPDIVSVATAIVAGNLDTPLYISPAGPISAIDILYGFQSDIRQGNSYMAHKTAFSDESLATSLISAGFSGALVARDSIFGLHAIATPRRLDTALVGTLMKGFLPLPSDANEVIRRGCYQTI